MKLLQDDVVDGSAVDSLAVDGSAAGLLGEVDLVVVAVLLGSAGQDGTGSVTVLDSGCPVFAQNL